MGTYRDSLAVFDGERENRGHPIVIALNSVLASSLGAAVGKPVEVTATGDTSGVGWQRLHQRALSYPAIWGVDSATIAADSAVVYVTTYHRITLPECSTNRMIARFRLRKQSGAWRILSKESVKFVDGSCRP